VTPAPRVGPNGAAPMQQFLVVQPSIDEEWWGPTGVWRSRGRLWAGHAEPLAISVLETPLAASSRIWPT
jgi:hypothetical protein